MTFKARGLYGSSSKEVRGFRAGPWMVLGAVLVVALVVVTVASVLSSINLSGDDHGDDHIYMVSGAASLEIDNRTGGEVSFTGGEGDELVLDRTMRDSPLTEARHEVSESGDVHVRADCGGVPFLGGCAVDYDITVPEGTAVAVETTSGRITAHNVDGELDLSAVSGPVEVSDHVGDVTVATTSGRVELSDVSGSVDAESVSGEITASGEGESLQLSTRSGTITASGFTAETVEASSTSGSLSVGGGFTTADVSAVSGSIDIATNDTFDLLALETTSGSIDVRVPDGTYAVAWDSVSGARAIGVDTSPDADARIEADSTSGSLTVSGR